MNFASELRRRRRGELFFMIIITALVALMVWLLGSHLLAPKPGTSPIDLMREWGIFPFFALTVVAWGAMMWWNAVHRRAHPYRDGSIHETLAALLDENRMQLRRYKWGAGLFILSVPLLGLVVYQLRMVGKAGDEILFPALVLYPLYVCGFLFCARWHYVRKLIPRQQELEATLRQYE